MSLNGISEDQDQSADKSFGSLNSLSHYENTSLKNLQPQILAAAVSTFPHLISGISLFYFYNVPNEFGINPDFSLTPVQISLMARTTLITVSVSGIPCAFLVERFGRLRTIGLSLILAMIGWTIVAASSSLTICAEGMAFAQIAVAWSTFAANVYITEIAHPDIRGSLLSFGLFFRTLGLGLLYFMSRKMSWRYIAGSTTIFAIIAWVLLFFIPESPVWLVSKERFQEAQKSLQWFDKHQPQINNNTFAQLHFEHLSKTKTTWSNGLRGKMKEFLKLFYKPFLILKGLLLLQHFSGFQFMMRRFAFEIPYYKGSQIGFYGLQMVASILNIVLLKFFARRILLVWGSAAAALCMLVHAIYVYFYDHDFFNSWISPVIIVLCLVFLLVVVQIPVTMMSELFPDQIRGMTCCILFPLINLMWFPNRFLAMIETFDGPTVVESFHVVVLLLGIVYTFLFVPETHRVKLSDVQKCFEHYKVNIKCVQALKRLSKRQNEDMAMGNV